MQAKFTLKLFEKDICSMSQVDPYAELRAGVRSVVTQFDSRYWQELDEARAFPEKFVNALAAAGWLSALIPEEYGGSNLSLTEASVIMEEINRAGGNSGACHGQMYVMGCVVRHGSKAQKEALLPKIASGELRMQAMAVTEPSTMWSMAKKYGPRASNTPTTCCCSRARHPLPRSRKKPKACRCSW
jgi:alkylation response protein AidB-like acyl-CoA dehydrogenase